MKWRCRLGLHRWGPVRTPQMPMTARVHLRFQSCLDCTARKAWRRVTGNWKWKRFAESSPFAGGTVLTLKGDKA